MEVRKYLVIVESNATGFSAYVPDLPGCIAAATTREQTLQLMQEAIEFHLEGMHKDGETIPLPISRAAIVKVALSAGSMSHKTPEEQEAGTPWFHSYMDRLENDSVVATSSGGEGFRCPCCHYKTLGERGGFEICPVCFWEDDGQDEHDADIIRGGPNGSLSLTQARAEFKSIGACKATMLRYVRPPLPEEI